MILSKVCIRYVDVCSGKSYFSNNQHGVRNDTWKVNTSSGWRLFLELLYKRK